MWEEVVVLLVFTQVLENMSDMGTQCVRVSLVQLNINTFVTIIEVESALELVIVACIVCIQDTQMSLNPSELFVAMAVAIINNLFN